jgi:hypothetical protein
MGRDIKKEIDLDKEKEEWVEHYDSDKPQEEDQGEE